MAKNNKKKFIIDLEIDSKTAEQQIKSSVKNFKDAIAKFGEGFGMTENLTDVVGYLNDIDALITAFKTKHGEDLFKNIFGDLDVNLKKELESAFGLTQDQLIGLSQLKTKLAELKGKDTTTKDDIKPLQDQVKALYKAAGMLDSLNLGGKGNYNVKNKIDLIETAIDDLVIHFKDAGKNLGKGINFQDALNIDQLADLKKTAKKYINDFYDELCNGADENKLDAIKDSLRRALSFDKRDFGKIDNVLVDFEFGEITDEDEVIEKINKQLEKIHNTKQKLQISQGDVNSTPVQTDDLQEVGVQIDGVTGRFHELINYISKTGQIPKAFFKALQDGSQQCDDELTQLLKSLKLMDDYGNLNFKTIDSGYSNKGGFVSDDYTLIGRDLDKYSDYSLITQQKSLEAKKLGANIGAVLEVYKDEAEGIVYELQNTVKGQEVIDFKNSMVNTDFLEATDAQILKLISDLEILQKTGLYVDWNGSNLLYDKENGFSFVDLIAESQWFTVSAENSVQENLNRFFDSVAEADPNKFLSDKTFQDRVYGLMNQGTQDDEVQNFMKYIDKINADNEAAASSLQKEESAHEQNTDAINAENVALQKQIDLKKEAQSMSWKDFALDESLSGAKQAHGLQTLGDMERFWKKANYDKEIDYSFIEDEKDVDKIINKHIPWQLQSDWYQDEDFDAKSKIENKILANNELRNAAMNKLYHLVKNNSEFEDQFRSISFDDFLNTEFEMYRGDDYPKLFGREQLTSFTFSKSTADSLADEFMPHIESIKITPKETVGSANTTNTRHELETLIPGDKLPSGELSLYINGKNTSFDDYYNNLTAPQKNTIDKQLLHMEAQRVKSILDDSVVDQIDDMQLNKYFDDIMSKSASQGVVPNELSKVDDLWGLYSETSYNDFADAYNQLPAMQKNLVTYYTKLKAATSDFFGKELASFDNVGNTGIIDAVMQDEAGVKRHVEKLTGESQFNLYGQNAQDISSEAAAHEKNTQAIKQEAQAQNTLMKAKLSYDEVNDKLTKQLLDFNTSFEEQQMLKDVGRAMEGVHYSEESYPDVIQDGEYISSQTGEILDVKDLLSTIQNIENTYGTNLDYIKGYLQQVYKNLDINADQLKSDIMSNADQLDANDVGKKLWDSIDYMEDYDKADALAGIYNQIGYIKDTALDHPNWINDGEYMNQVTGEILDVSDLLDTIKSAENEFGEDLNYVKAYLNQVYKNYFNQVGEAFDLSDVVKSSTNDMDVYDLYGEEDYEVCNEPESSGIIYDATNEIQQLDKLKAKIEEVKVAIDEKTQAFREEEAVVDTVVMSEVSAIQKLLDTLQEVVSKLNLVDDAFKQTDNDIIKQPDQDVVDKTSETDIKVPQGSDNKYALDSTLSETNSILGQILSAINSGEGMSNLVSSLDGAISELKNVANGIVKHQQAQKTDYTDSTAKIQNHYGQLSAIAQNSISQVDGFTDEVQINKMKSLADGVVAVEGAAKNADGVWEGFIVHINESNNAIINSIGQQSAFAKSLNETTTAAKTLADNIDNLDDVDSAPSELSIQEITKGIAELKGLSKDVTKEFDSLGFISVDKNLTEEQTEIKNLYQATLSIIGKYQQEVASGNKIELDSLNDVVSALRQKIALYKENQGILNSNKSGQKFGATAVLNESARYNQLQNYASDVNAGFANSSVFMAEFNKYTAAYDDLIAKRKELATLDNVTDAQEAEFRQLQKECAAAAKSVEKLVQESLKLKNGGTGKQIRLGEDFVDTLDGRKRALTDFVEGMHGTEAELEKFSDNYTKLIYTIKNGDGTFTRMTASLDGARTAIVETAGDTQKITTAFGKFFGELKHKFRSIGQYFISSMGVEEIWQQFRNGIQYVRDIDLALTELKKVTNETDATYTQFLQHMSEVGSEIGATTANLTNSAADWARLGYAIQEAGELAKSTAVLLNVSEFENVEEATEAMISSLQAYNYEAMDSIQIVDKLNVVGNNFAVSTDGAAEALKRSASTLVESGNSLEQSLAMVAAANKVIQDPEQVGAALKVLSLRLRGTKTELEAMGESTEGMATTTSKLRDQVFALTNIDGTGGVDILTASGEYRDTYDVLVDIAEVYDDILAKDNKDAAALTELLAGKHRANVLSSLLQNPEDLKDAYEMALDSEGSAMAENEKYLDSIQGRIDLFTNSLQTMWMDTLDSDMVKFVIDLGNATIKLIDTLGMLPTALGAFAGFSVAKDLIKADFKEIENGGKSVSNIFDKLTSVLNKTANASNQAAAADQAKANAAQANVNATNQDTAAKQANAQATNEDTAAEKANSQVVNEDTTVEKTNTQAVNQDTAVEKINTTATNQGTAAEKLKTVATDQSAAADMREKVASDMAAASDAAEAASGGTGILSSLLGGKTAGSLGKFTSKLGAFAKGGLKGLAVGAVITLATAGITKLIGKVGELHVSQEEAAQSAEETLNAYTATTEELKTTKSTISDLSSEFETLSSGVDKHGNNINLSTEEYKRYNEIANQIAGLFPQMINGYTAEGNAILSCKGDVDALTDAYKAQEQAARQALIQDGDNIFTTFKNNYNSDLAEQQAAVERMIELYNSGDYDGIASVIRSSGDLSDLWTSLGVDSSDIFSRWSGLNEAEFDKIAPQLHSYMQSLQTKINAEAANVTPLIAAYMGEDVNYQALETEQQNAIATLVSNLDADFLNQYDSAEDVYAWVRENFITPLSDPAISEEFSNAIDSMFATQEKFDQGKMSLGAYQNEIGSFVSYINSMDIDEEAKIQLADMFDISLDDATQLDAEVEAMVGRAKKILKEEDWSKISSLGLDDLQMIDALEIEDGVTYSWEELHQKIKDVQNELGTTVDSSSTYSALSAEVDSYNELLTQTSEVVANNTEITQDYKDSLAALVGDQDAVNACFYEGNPLVVKNAQALQELVESARNNISANIELAESQTRLQYRELVLELSNTCSSTKELTEETISSTHAILDQIDTVQLAIQKYQLLQNNLELAGGAFDKFKQAQEVDALNTTGTTMVEMAQTMYDAFNETGQVGTEAFNSAVKALVPDSVYAHLKTEGEQLEAIYSYFKKDVLPTLTNDDGTLSIDSGDIDDFVGQMQELNILTKDSSKRGELNIVENMELKEAARLMGMTEAQFSAMLMEVEKYDFNPNGTSLLSQFLGTWDDDYAVTLAGLEDLNRQKLALLEDGGYEKHKEEIDGINEKIKVAQTELGEFGDEAYESFGKFAKAETALTALEELTQEEREATKMTQELADALHLGDLDIDWDNKTVQQVYDEVALIKEKIGEPSELQLDVAVDEVESDLARIEKELAEKDIKISAHVVQDEETGEYTVTDTSGLNKEEITLVEDYADLKNLQTLLPDYISKGMTATEQSLSNIETIVGAIATKIKADVPSKDDDSAPQASSTTTDSKSDKFVPIGDLFSKSRQKNDEAHQKGQSQTKNHQKPVTDVKVPGVITDPVEYEVFVNDQALTNLEAKLDKINNLTEDDRELVIDAVAKYKDGGDLSDLITQIQSIEDEEIRAEVIASITEEGSLDQFLSSLGNKDKKIVIKALTEGTGDVEALNNIINSLPPEVQSEVRALVDSALKDVETVDGKLQEVDNTTATAEVETIGTEVSDKKINNLIGIMENVPDNVITNVSAPGAQYTIEEVQDLINTAKDVPSSVKTKVSAPGAITAKDQVDDARKAVQDADGESANLGVKVSVTETIKGAFKVLKKKLGLANGTVQANLAVANGTAHAKGTAWAGGTARKGGSWGAPRTETALTGELGPELIVRGNRWFTVGEQGAEFAQIQKGDIIFNHKQTEQLLSNGYVTSRGKLAGGAHAQGTAHAEGTAYALWSVEKKKSGGGDGDGYKVTKTNDKKKNKKKAKEEFQEIFDWFEVKIEEINEDLDLMAAKLENAITIKGKNNILSDMIATNKSELKTLEKGKKLYETYADGILKEKKTVKNKNGKKVKKYIIPEKYWDEVKDGKVAIEEFYGKVDEKILEQIKNYREWAQKVADLKKNMQEVRREITELAKQKFDNISEKYDNIEGLQDNRQQHYVDMAEYREDKGWINSGKYYEAAKAEEENKKKSKKNEKKKLQASLDASVKKGDIKRGSAEWYDMVNQIHAVDAEIDECTANIEDYQNRINEIHFENFEKGLYRVSRIADETQNIIDLMADKDAFETPDTDDGWKADDVIWTKEGITQMGLHAQNMENYKKQSEMYAAEIDEVNQMYDDGKISYTEYIEKLDKLKDGQYDAIQGYEDSKEAIIDMQKARVDEIKNGIDKQIEAETELIENRKEELDAEKDLWDFQKNVMNQEKDMADIQRKLAALSADNSASAMAKRRQLEAQLAEAQTGLEDTYYERSIENKQTALDNQLEFFTETREAEKEMWDKYLEDTEQVFKDSMDIIAESGTTIKTTLKEVGAEWDLQINDHIKTPWNDASTALETTALALDGVIERFQTAVSEADSLADTQIANQKEDNQDITAQGERGKNNSGNPLKGVKVTANSGTKIYDKDGKVTSTLKKDTSYTAGKTDSKGMTELLNSKGKVVGYAKASELNEKFQKGMTINADGAQLFDSATDKQGQSQDLETYEVLEVDSKNKRVKAKSKKKNSSGKYVTGWFDMSQVTITKKAPSKKTTTTDGGKKTTTDGGKKTTTETVKYYKKYTGKSNSISDALKAIGADGSYDNRAKIAKANGIKNYSGTDKQNTKLLNLLKNGKLKKYAKGSLGISKDQLAWIDELGEELQLVPNGNGRLEYVKKGTGIIPADLTSNLMEWGKLDPTAMIEQNRPSIGASPEVHATEINLNIQYGDMLKIDNFKGDNPDEIAKIVAKQFEKHTKDLNNALRKYVR